MIIAIVIIMLTAVFAPLASDIASHAYAAGYDIMLDANESLAGIQDDAIRDQIQAGLNSAAGAQGANVLYTSSLYKYSWVIVIGVVALVLFMYSRQLIEYGYRGGFI